MTKLIANSLILALCVSVSSSSPALPATEVLQAPAYIGEWGSYGSENGQFNIPVGVAVDAVGNVFVGESGGSRIQKFTNAGAYLAQWPAFHPQGVAVDVDGNVFATVGAQGLAKFSGSGELLAQWSRTGTGLAIDRSGVVYVATRSSIARFTSAGTTLPEWPDSNYPDGVAVDVTGNVFVVGTDPADLVEKLASDGTLLTSWGSYGAGAGQFDTPTRAAVDPSGNVYVADYGNNRIEIFSNDGAYLGQFGGTGSGPGQFAGPMGVAIDASGFIYVADANNNRIQKFGPLPTPARTSSWGQLKSLYH
ncbi:MAG: 6-bladed beta-propeller [Candidatus Eiseniibacteriota bacterium]